MVAERPEEISMIPQGFYRGKGPFWLIGWQGKVFDSPIHGYNVFIWGIKGLSFTWLRYDDGTIIIWYHSPFHWVRDVMTPTETGWEGQIYVMSMKVPWGKFELRRER